MLNRLDVIFQLTFLFTPVITISLPANVPNTKHTSRYPKHEKGSIYWMRNMKDDDVLHLFALKTVPNLLTHGKKSTNQMKTQQLIVIEVNVHQILLCSAKHSR